MGSSWKLVSVFAVIFLTGALCGWLVTSATAVKPPPQNSTRNVRSWADELTDRIEKNGQLTSDQRTAIRPRLEEAVRKMQAIRFQSMVDLSDAFDSAIVDIESSLLPQQKAHLERFRDRRRKWLQKQIEKQREQQNEER
jgi:hypothetical protein